MRSVLCAMSLMVLLVTSTAAQVRLLPIHGAETGDPVWIAKHDNELLVTYAGGCVGRFDAALNFMDYVRGLNDYCVTRLQVVDDHLIAETSSGVVLVRDGNDTWEPVLTTDTHVFWVDGSGGYGLSGRSVYKITTGSEVTVDLLLEVDPQVDLDSVVALGFVRDTIVLSTRRGYEVVSINGAGELVANMVPSDHAIVAFHPLQDGSLVMQNAAHELLAARSANFNEVQPVSISYQGQPVMMEKPVSVKSAGDGLVGVGTMAGDDSLRLFAILDGQRDPSIIDHVHAIPTTGSMYMLMNSHWYEFTEGGRRAFTDSDGLTRRADVFPGVMSADMSRMSIPFGYVADPVPNVLGAVTFRDSTKTLMYEPVPRELTLLTQPLSGRDKTPLVYGFIIGHEFLLLQSGCWIRGQRAAPWIRTTSFTYPLSPSILYRHLPDNLGDLDRNGWMVVPDSPSSIACSETGGTWFKRTVPGMVSPITDAIDYSDGLFTLEHDTIRYFDKLELSENDSLPGERLGMAHPAGLTFLNCNRTFVRFAAPRSTTDPSRAPSQIDQVVLYAWTPYDPYDQSIDSIAAVIMPPFARTDSSQLFIRQHRSTTVIWNQQESRLVLLSGSHVLRDTTYALRWVGRPDPIIIDEALIYPETETLWLCSRGHNVMIGIGLRDGSTVNVREHADERREHLHCIVNADASQLLLRLPQDLVSEPQRMRVHYSSLGGADIPASLLALNSVDGELLITSDIRSLPSGVYLAAIEVDGSSYSCKFSIVR